mmetsp:Transcript_27607/g.51312  ORF Transcript_27607/g.51312 Transcript_27607/m.51312 type:complete len:99 (-) Transcript_27607:122-418(-)
MDRTDVRLREHSMRERRSFDDAGFLFRLAIHPRRIISLVYSGRETEHRDNHVRISRRIALSSSSDGDDPFKIPSGSAAGLFLGTILGVYWGRGETAVI